MPTITPVSGGASVVTSGVYIPSGGTSGTFSGPWYVVTQEMSFYYGRVPQMAPVASALLDVISLSALNTRIFQVAGTFLNIVLTASVKKQKIYGAYDTSAWTQYQKFGIAAEDDMYGNSYGATSGTHVMGPRGQVITTQPYISRVPWDDNLHSESTSSVQATNMIVYHVSVTPGTAGAVYGTFNPLVGGTYANLTDNANQGDFVLMTPHAWNTVADEKICSTNPLYLINGTYATTKENSQQFTSLLTLLGDQLKSGGLLLKPVLTAGTDITGPTGTLGLPVIGSYGLASTAYAQLSAYESSRHIYT